MTPIIVKGIKVLQFDLNHQAGVMYAIHDFVDVCLNYDMSDEEFIFFLEPLWCAFEAYKQEGVEYAASIMAFADVTEFVNSQRDVVRFSEYLSTLSIADIKSLRRKLYAHRWRILDEIRSFKRNEERNRQKLLIQFEKAIKAVYSSLIVRVDLDYRKEMLSEITVHEFYQHISSLCSAITDKNGCFDSLLTYGLALEQGVTKGFHAHLALVYNASDHQCDWDIAEKIIEKWREITQGYGDGQNINTAKNKKRYERKKRLGVGRIFRRNPQQCINALCAIAYLTSPEKFDQMLLIKVQGTRSFYKGDYQHHGRSLPDTMENEAINKWSTAAALAKLEDEIWYKKL